MPLGVVPVIFFGRRNLQGSLKWMGAFWLSVAGALCSVICPLLQAPLILARDTYEVDGDECRA